MSDLDEDLIPLVQSPGGNAPTKPLHTSSMKPFKLQYYIPKCLPIMLGSLVVETLIIN